MFTITYSLEPLESSVNHDNLASLRNDITIIARSFRQEILQLARQYIDKADKTK
jgi:hypothetical protein